MASDERIMLIDDAKERTETISTITFFSQKNMKVIESYGKDTVAGCRDTKAGLSCLVISDFPSSSYAIFIRPNERA